MKPARLRPSAEDDVTEAIRWYAEQGGPALGLRFFSAARAAIGQVEQMPGIGSPRIGERCGLPDLRSWPVARFPVRWFYFERGDHLDVVRLLGERQRVEAILGGEPPAAG